MKQVPIDTDKSRAIRQTAPKFDELSSTTELLETSIKVIDLLCPFAKGGKVGLFRWCRCGQNRKHDGIDQQHRQSAQRSVRVRRCG